MKKLVLITAMVSSLGVASVANAGHKQQNHYDNVRYDRAKVIHVEPVSGYTQNRYPTERCYRTGSDRDRRKGSVVGAVIGSVVGYKLGGDRGEKRLGTVAGAVVGSAIGQSVADKGRDSHYRCEVVEERYGHAAIIGYNVTYKYKGQRYTTFMDYDPGRWLDIEVSVRPGRGYRH